MIASTYALIVIIAAVLLGVGCVLAVSKRESSPLFFVVLAGVFLYVASAIVAH